MKKRIFSGAQPTGNIHIGNYLGALKNWVAFQEEYDGFYCIVNLHAITTSQNPEKLRRQTLDLAKLYIACGIDPEKSTVFVQSDVSCHAELAWVLSCTARMGELERMTQFKDKAGAKGERASVGLFTYPILMAADILLYQTDLVPVGSDQKQHLELARDIAARFNRDFGEAFVIPEPYIPPVGAKIMSLSDPSLKMSKSDENENSAVLLLDDPDTVARKIRKAVTDSGTEIRFDETRPAINNLLTIYQLMTDKSAGECESQFAEKGYGAFKTELAEAMIEFLRPIQEKFHGIDDRGLEAILDDGAARAKEVASVTMKDVYKKMGIR